MLSMQMGRRWRRMRHAWRRFIRRHLARRAWSRFALGRLATRSKARAVVTLVVPTKTLAGRLAVMSNTVHSLLFWWPFHFGLKVSRKRSVKAVVMLQKPKKAEDHQVLVMM